jgi:hypothetical protein
MAIVSYRIGSKKGKAEYILVEVDDDLEGLPREASLETVKRAAQDFEPVLKSLSTLSKSVVEALKSAKPSELSVEFGIELGGAGGLPHLIKAEGKANFKVTLKWKEAKGAGAHENQE